MFIVKTNTQTNLLTLILTQLHKPSQLKDDQPTKQ